MVYEGARGGRSTSIWKPELATCVFIILWELGGLTCARQIEYDTVSPKVQTGMGRLDLAQQSDRINGLFSSNTVDIYATSEQYCCDGGEYLLCVHVTLASI